MEQKRFYWLKLHEDFFRQKDIKKLRQIAGGDTYTVIYLKMLLSSLRTGGKLYFDGVEEDFPSELALDIDESVENVSVTVQYLIARGILQRNDSDEYELLTAAEMTGSESDSAHRVRNHRAQKVLQSNGITLQSNNDVTKCNTEIDIEKRVRKKSESIDRADKPPRALRFSPPSVDDVRAYCLERKNTIDAERFVDYYAQQGWKLANGNPMKDWRAAVRTWEKRENQKDKPFVYDYGDTTGDLTEDL
ncbi:MAG: phage replisome organizer N-terminal domain-containing protein [Oscillospiraceae bacterium]|nr:phage replisome organizer N-terminal domain-containing protein [Oscillospiraceae bacterium]